MVDEEDEAYACDATETVARQSDFVLSSCYLPSIIQLDWIPTPTRERERIGRNVSFVRDVRASIRQQ